MRVNLRVGFFENKAYAVHMNAESLCFENAEETVEIPYANILRVTIVGAASTTDGFSLETDGGVYRGHFETVDDAKQFLEAVGKRLNGQLAVDLSRL